MTDKNENRRSKFAPKKTTKEEMRHILGSHLPELLAHSEALDSLMITLGQTQSNDASLSTIEMVKNVLAGMDSAKKKTREIRDILTSRARTKLNGEG